MKPGFLGRYLATVGVILAVLVGVGMMTKPPPERLRDGVEGALAQYAEARTGSGGSAPVVTDRASHDFLIAASHQARADAGLFYCFGGFFITVCQSPD